MTAKLLSAAEAANQVPRWQVQDNALQLTVNAASFVAALAFVNKVGELAEQQNHHPDIDIRYATVQLSVTSHDAGGLTDRDVRLANSVTGLVDRLGLTPES